MGREQFTPHARDHPRPKRGPGPLTARPRGRTRTLQFSAAEKKKGTGFFFISEIAEGFRRGRAGIAKVKKKPVPFF
jgi:hypothetical protein